MSQFRNNCCSNNSFYTSQDSALEAAKLALYLTKAEHLLVVNNSNNSYVISNPKQEVKVNVKVDVKVKQEFILLTKIIKIS